MKEMERWKKAVVHLECAGDSKGLDEQVQLTSELRERFMRGEISREQFSDELLAGHRDVRSRGTAVFLSHEDIHYLITARHVVHDKEAAARDLQKEAEIQASLGQGIIDEGLKSKEGEVADYIFCVIFRVPRPVEVRSGKTTGPREFVMNLRAGLRRIAPYTFSSPELDVAVISLRRTPSNFARELLSRGYSPVSIDDIEDAPSVDGAEIFSVGYPEATSVLGEQNLGPAEIRPGSSEGNTFRGGEGSSSGHA